MVTRKVFQANLQKETVDGMAFYISQNHNNAKTGKAFSLTMPVDF